MYKNENSVSKDKYWLEGSKLDPLNSYVSLGCLVSGLLGASVTIVLWFSCAIGGYCSKSQENIFMAAVGLFMVMAIVPSIVFVAIKLQGLTRSIRDRLSGR